VGTVNIAIIGGGITGLSAAYHLARMGVEGVEVFEAKYVGYGSTGRCAAGIRASFTSKVHVSLMKEAIKGWMKWSKNIEGLEFRQSGYLWLLTSEEMVEQHKALMKLHNSLGVPTKLVYGEEVRGLVPTIELNDVIAALHDPTAGKADPFETTMALRRFLINSGIKIHEYTAVRSVKTSSGRATAIDVEGIGEIKVSGSIIIAAGYWSKELLSRLGFDLPVVGEPHHLLITEKVAPLIEPLVIHKESGSYINQVPTGGLILGAEYPVPERDLFLRVGFITKAVKYMSKYFPQILIANLLRVWIGYYLKTPDNHPLIGAVPFYDNIYVATGFSGHGYMMSPIVGEELANLVVKGRTRLSETAELSPDRFEKGRFLEEKSVFG